MARLLDSVEPLVKNDFLGVGPDERGALPAGGLDALLGLPAEAVVAAPGLPNLVVK